MGRRKREKEGGKDLLQRKLRMFTQERIEERNRYENRVIQGQADGYKNSEKIRGKEGKVRDEINRLKKIM